MVALFSAVCVWCKIGAWVIVCGACPDAGAAGRADVCAEARGCF